MNIGSPPRRPPPILVSACLAGVDCTYKGDNKLREALARLVREGGAIPICPEVLAGFPVPREESQISDGSGEDVLGGRARVRTRSGRDVTAGFLRGAREALRIAREVGARRAILKARSPSCGFGWIHDGTFSETLRPGTGVAAALLAREGIQIETEEEWEAAAGRRRPPARRAEGRGRRR